MTLMIVFTVRVGEHNFNVTMIIIRRITQVTDDIRESAFLFQHLSVLIQRYNAVAIQGTFAHTTSEDEFSAVPAYLFLTFVFNPRDLYCRGQN